MVLNKKLKNKIGLFDHLYTASLGDYQVIYNPFSYKGQLVLAKNIYLALKDILGKKLTYGRSIILFADRFPELNKNDIKDIFDNLFKYDLISEEGKKNYFHYDPNVSKKQLVFWIDITNQCNFKCTYCFVDRKKEIIDPDTFRKLLSRLIKLRRRYRFTKLVFIFSGGEPLMYFSTLKKIAAEIDIFQKKTENKIAIEKKIITNASLLTDDIAIFLKQNKINTNISLDGIGRYNNLTRKFIYGRKPTYPLIKRGIEIARKHNILSHITATITAKNIEHLPDFASYLLKQKIKFQFQFYKEVNQHCHEKPVKIDEKTSASYLRAIKTVYRMYGEMDQKNETANPLNDKYQPMFISEQGCAAGNMEFTITPDCQIKVCPASEVKIPYDKTEDFIRDIKKINAPFTDYSVDTHPICKKCLWRYLCKGGCRLEMLKYDKLRSIPPRCYIFKKMLPLAIKLEAKRIINTNIISLAKT